MQPEIVPDQSVELELKVDSKPRQLRGLVKSIEGPVLFLQVEGLAPEEAEGLDSANVRVWLASVDGLYSIPGRGDIVSGRLSPLLLRVHLLMGRAEKTQRRDYFRLRTKEFINFLPEISWGDAEVQGWREAHTIDLSGNGLSFRAKELLAAGAHVQLRLFLAERTQPIVIGARVVSAVHMNRSNAHKIVVQFVEINERERWQIIGYLNSLQSRKCGYL